MAGGKQASGGALAVVIAFVIHGHASDEEHEAAEGESFLRAQRVFHQTFGNEE